MEWLNGNVGSTESPLQETPEVFDAVGVDLSANVGLNMIDNLMHEPRLESIVSGGIVGIEFGFLVYMGQDFSLQGLALHVGNNLGTNFAGITVKKTHDDGFPKCSTALVVTHFLVGVHVLNSTANKSFVSFYGSTIAAEL